MACLQPWTGLGQVSHGAGAQTHRKIPGRFKSVLTDGHVEIDNTTVERCMRPIVLDPKNALFAGQDTGAQNRAMFASISKNCQLNKVDLYAYMTSVLTAISHRFSQGHEQKYIEPLRPWNVGK